MDLSHFFWLVGLFEGEGCFTTCRRSPRDVTKAKVQINMIDEDVIARVADLLNASYYEKKSEHQLQYRIDIKGARAVEIMKMFYPYLGNRRRARIDELLATVDLEDGRGKHWKQKRAAKKTARSR